MKRVELQLDQGLMQLKTSTTEQQREKILNALDGRLNSSNCADQEAKHSSVRQGRVGYTLSWFLFDPTFRQWLDPHQDTETDVNYSKHAMSMEKAPKDSFDSMHIQNYIPGCVILCQGLPGSGKTTLTSTIINFLRHTSEGKKARVVYFHIDYQDEHEQL
ncbi:MAG: hypothetical protein Q9159_002580 [Coniocarpon cinnabarinum]